MEKWSETLISRPPPSAMVKGCWVPLAFLAAAVHVMPLQMARIWFPYAFEFEPPKSNSPNGVTLETGTLMTGPKR